MTTNETIQWLRDEGVLLLSGRLSPKYLKILEGNEKLQLALVKATSFLQYQAPLKVRIACLTLNIMQQPTCKTCNKIVKMSVTGPRLYTFPLYCSSKCFSGLDSVIASRQKTSMDRYDAVSFGASPEGKLQYKQTMLKKYGVSNSALIPGSAEKRLDTIVEKYGSVEKMQEQASIARENTINLTYGSRSAYNKLTKDRQKLGMIEKYGEDNAFKLPEIQQKIINTMQERYGVDKPLQNKQIRQKFVDSMVKKHGNSNFWVGQFPEGTAEKLNDKQYMATLLSTTNTADAASMLGVTISTIYSWAAKHDIQLRYINQYEQQIQQFLESVGVDYIINDRTILNPKEIDIVIPDRKLGIECNGIFWHSELSGRNSAYHLDKTINSAAAGYRLIHITDYEWVRKTNIVKSRILGYVGKFNKIAARKCSIVEVSSSDYRAFCEINHIQGCAAASIRYGLVYEGKLVAVMSFGKNRFGKTHTPNTYELIRSCNILNTTVVGGASKLFAHFVKTINPTEVVSYSDKRWNTGELYKKLGFALTHSSNPNYSYFNRSSNINKVELYSRLTFQKHKLKDKLNSFDPELTEWQNMVANGYDRIWDCGNDVFVWRAQQ